MQTTVLGGALSQGFDRLTDAELLAEYLQQEQGRNRSLNLAVIYCETAIITCQKLVSMGVSDIVAGYRGIGPGQKPLHYWLHYSLV